MSSGTSQGKIAMVVRSTDSFATRDKTNSTMPSGGCSRPIIRFSVMIRPKCTGSMPNFSDEWQQDRHEDGDGGDRIEEAADDQHQHVNEDQEHPFVLGNRQD